MAAILKNLSALLKQGSIDDHEEVLNACNAALKTSKNNAELLHVKLVALLKLDRYNDALRILEEGGNKLKETVKVERAYALYKIGKLEEAKAIAQEVTEGRGARHIEAQAVWNFSLHVEPLY